MAEWLKRQGIWVVLGLMFLSVVVGAYGLNTDRLGIALVAALVGVASMMVGAFGLGEIRN